MHVVVSLNRDRNPMSLLLVQALILQYPEKPIHLRGLNIMISGIFVN